ncbi:MAG: hypothetical protein QXU32_03370 [Nitrososphaerales archaeon]
MNEESKHKPYLYIIVGMASLLAFAVIVQVMVPKPYITHDASLHILPVPVGAERYPNIEPLICSTKFTPVLDESSKIKYNVMTPKLLPAGYYLQGVDVISSAGVEMITLYYWDRPLCDMATNLEGGPALNGAVVVHIANSLKVPDAFAQTIDTVNKIVPKYDFRKVLINGMPGIGNQPNDGHAESFPYPARIFVMKNNMLYNIEANMPLEDLVKIAESIN